MALCGIATGCEFTQEVTVLILHTATAPVHVCLRKLHEWSNYHSRTGTPPLSYMTTFQDGSRWSLGNGLFNSAELHKIMFWRHSSYLPWIVIYWNANSVLHIYISHIYLISGVFCTGYIFFLGLWTDLTFCFPFFSNPMSICGVWLNSWKVLYSISCHL